PLDVLATVPHHMIGCIPVEEAYNAARYRKDALQQLQDILRRGKIPIVVGGTGLYFQALIQGFDPAPPSDPVLRKELEQLSLPTLQERLLRIDPNAVTEIDMRNPRRVLRAVEICELSGHPLKTFRSQRGPISAVRGWTLLRDREELHRRISVNVDHMWKKGVVQEVEAIRQRVGDTASRSIGFREILKFLDGKLSETECRKAICLATRRYAKRQLTWFRHQTTFKTLNLSVFKNGSVAVDALFRECSIQG
ncbi:MAG: tRNA (adenosine(37)-N6)-dimethylallyltransferase MiaA, partial [Verrucomicrobia bacterium]